jgi:hypothetical protein
MHDNWKKNGVGTVPGPDRGEDTMFTGLMPAMVTPFDERERLALEPGRHVRGEAVRRDTGSNVHDVELRARRSGQIDPCPGGQGPVLGAVGCQQCPYRERPHLESFSFG